MKKFFQDFKKFISKGNVLDLAVAVIIGAAFGAIVTSLVKDIIMPLVTWAVGKNSLAELSVVLRPATETAKALTWNYGNFIQAIIDFFIIAFVVFCFVKIVMGAKNGIEKANKRIEKQIEKAKRKGKPVSEELAMKIQETPKPETQEDILKEIRDLLKSQAKSENKKK